MNSARPYCGGERYTLSRVPTGEKPAGGPKPIDKVELIFEDPPGEPFASFEMLEADSSGNGHYAPDTPRALTMIKEAAAQDGADGLHSVKCARPGTIGEGRCTGIAFVYKK